MDRITKAKALLLLDWDSEGERQQTGTSSEQDAGQNDESDEAATRALADVIGRSGLTRPLATLAVIVQEITMSQGKCASINKEIDQAEISFMRAAEAVIEAWEHHDEA